MSSSWFPRIAWHNPEEGGFEFSIPHFKSLLGTEPGKLFTSEPFWCEGHRWALRWYPNGDSSDTEGNLSLFLMLESSLSSEAGVATKWEFSIIHDDPTKTLTRSSEGNISISSGRGKCKFCTHETLNSLLSPEGALDLRVKMLSVGSKGTDSSQSKPIEYHFGHYGNSCFTPAPSIFQVCDICFQMTLLKEEAQIVVTLECCSDQFQANTQYVQTRQGWQQQELCRELQEQLKKQHSKPGRSYRFQPMECQTSGIRIVIKSQGKTLISIKTAPHTFTKDAPKATWRTKIVDESLLTPQQQHQRRIELTAELEVVSHNFAGLVVDAGFTSGAEHECSFVKQQCRRETRLAKEIRYNLDQRAKRMEAAVTTLQQQLKDAEGEKQKISLKARKEKAELEQELQLQVLKNSTDEKSGLASEVASAGKNGAGKKSAGKKGAGKKGAGSKSSAFPIQEKHHHEVRKLLKQAMANCSDADEKNGALPEKWFTAGNQVGISGKVGSAFLKLNKKSFADYCTENWSMPKSKAKLGEAIKWYKYTSSINPSVAPSPLGSHAWAWDTRAARAWYLKEEERFADADVDAGFSEFMHKLTLCAQKAFPQISGNVPAMIPYGSVVYQVRTLTSISIKVIYIY
jgi:hypothetical protein